MSNSILGQKVVSAENPVQDYLDLMKEITYERASSEVVAEKSWRRFMDWISKTDFFRAPASTRFHGSFEGGLVEHHVADSLVIQRPAVQPDIVRLAADLHARVLRRPAVHRHAPRAHHRFDFASRTLAEQRKQLVKPHFVAQILVPQALSFHVFSIIQHDRRFCNLAARLAIFLSTHTICFSFVFFVRVGRKTPAWTRCVQKLSGFRGSSWKHHMNLLFLLHRLWYNADKRKKLRDNEARRFPMRFSAR